jgi:hypothetical protein
MSVEERYKITRRPITKLMPGKKHELEDEMNVTRNECSRPPQRFRHLLADKMSRQLRFVMMLKLEYVMYVAGRHCLRPSQRFRHLMSAKMSRQLRFVMVTKLEHVMNVTRRHFSGPSQRFRHLMTAQPDLRNQSSRTEDTALMTPTPTVWRASRGPRTGAEEEQRKAKRLDMIVNLA